MAGMRAPDAGASRPEAVDAFFAGQPLAAEIFAVLAAGVAGLDGTETRVQTSQIGFVRAHPFAAAWVPAQHLGRPGAPLVLSVFLRRRDASPRWKQVVAPRPGRFTHHLELYAPADVDAEVRNWLREAWQEAGKTA